MPGTVTDFLIDLSTDPRRQAAFEADPEAVLTASELSPPDRALLRSRDSGAIRSALLDAPPSPGMAQEGDDFFVVIIVADDTPAA